MLTEVGTRQPSRELARRWFSDDDFDLVVWSSDAGAIVGFELCYDKSGVEHALTWTASDGYGHFRVDSGEPSPVKNLTPILERDGPFAQERVLAGFLAASTRLEPAIRAFVAARLEAYAAAS